MTLKNPQWKSNTYRQEGLYWVQRTNEFIWNNETRGLERYDRPRVKVYYDEMRDGENFGEQYKLIIKTTTNIYYEKPSFLNDIKFIPGTEGFIDPADQVIVEYPDWYSYIYKCHYCIPQQNNRPNEGVSQEIDESSLLISYDPQTVVNVSPNPARDILNIAIEDNGAGEVVIYDFTGKQHSAVFTITGQNTLAMSLDGFADGVYVCQYISATGNRSSKRFVVAK